MLRVKSILGAMFSVLFMVTAMAQDGAVGKKKLDEIRSSYQHDAYTRAMENALSNNDINKLAWNRENLGKDDHYFTYRVDVTGITDQKGSGRCWMFTSMNVLRPKVMKKLNISSFEFSQNYLYFWDIFEKSNLFLNNSITSADLPFTDRRVNWFFRSPIDDGGVWNSFTNLVVKYGLVPKEVMPESQSSENTRWMIKHIKSKLREDGLKLRVLKSNGAKESTIEEAKVAMLKEIYRMLALNLGEPPVEFQWRYEDKDGVLSAYKTYTPQNFRDEMLGEVAMDDYVMIMNDPTRPYYKHYEIENYRNTAEGVNWHYVNLPNDVIKQFAVASIKNNEAMYASCDVGAFLNRDYGILDVNNFDYESLYGVSFGMDKKGRILTGESGSSHGMALIAVDLGADGNPTKWQFENSWGENSGHNGYLTFTDEWFNEYMFRFVIHKKFLDEKTLNVYQEKASVLPPWDPMF